MSVELRPLGVACNIRCKYCYQNSERFGGEPAKEYDISVMKEAVTRHKTSFILFGGEPLLVPERDLEDLWAWGWKKFGRNGIQTNGTLINDNHIRMFREYAVHVGISIDGPGELNDVRWVSSLEETRRSTENTIRAIKKLCEANLHPSLIITLHRGNGVGEKLARLTEWLHDIDNLGIRSVRLHILEVDNPVVRKLYTLSDSENIFAFLHFARAERYFKNIRFDLFSDLRCLLSGQDQKTSCVWRACDPYSTAAVKGIEGFGQQSNCGRTNKDGVGYAKAQLPGYERYIALHHASQEDGGCGGCEYFIMCKGQCPGTAVDGDWRNRSEHCNVWKALFSHVESEMVRAHKPVLSHAQRKFVTDRLLAAWRVGTNPTVHSILQNVEREEEVIAP